MWKYKSVMKDSMTAKSNIDECTVSVESVDEKEEICWTYILNPALHSGSLHNSGFNHPPSHLSGPQSRLCAWPSDV